MTLKQESFSRKVQLVEGGGSSTLYHYNKDCAVSDSSIESYRNNFGTVATSLSKDLMSYTEMYRIGLAPGEAITSYAMDGAGSRRVMVVCSMHSYRISSLDIVAPLLSVMHRLEEVVDDSLVNARGVISTTIRSDMHVVVVDLDPEATSEDKEPLDPTGDASGDALVVGNAYLTSLCSNMNYFVSYDRSIKMKIPPSPLKVSSGASTA